MITIYDTQVLEIGKPGENGAVRFRFDVADWLEYGLGTFTMSHQRATDSYPYPVDVTLEDHYVVWVISDIDNAVVGNGKAELIYSVGDTVIKSATMTTHTRPTLDEPDDTPDAYESWIQRLADIKDDIVGEATYTQGLIDGIPTVVDQYIEEHRDELKGDPGITTVDDETKQEIVADVIDAVNVPANLSELTDDLGDSPVHTHSQYLTEHQSLTDKQDTLVSGTNIKTIDGRSITGSGDLGVRRPSDYAIVTGSDLDNSTEPGVYRIGASPDYTYDHCPTISGYATLYVDYAGVSTSEMLQTIVVESSHVVYRRTRTNNVWSEWIQATGIVQKSARYTQNEWLVREYTDGTVKLTRKIAKAINITVGGSNAHFRSNEESYSLPFDLSQVDSIQLSANISNRSYTGVSLSGYTANQIKYYLWSGYGSISNASTEVFITVEGVKA